MSRYTPICANFAVPQALNIAYRLSAASCPLSAAGYNQAKSTPDFHNFTIYNLQFIINH